MRPIEIAAFALSVVAILVIFLAELFREDREPGRIPAPMLFVFRLFLGVVFSALGVIGVLLPILPGWVFFLLAWFVLFPHGRFTVNLLDKVEPKVPRVVAWLRKFGIGEHREGATIADR